MILYTTLNLIKKQRPCERGYRKLRHALGKGWKADRKIPFVQILDSNGLYDALWAMRAVADGQEAERDRICRLVAADFAEHVLPFFEKVFADDDRPRKAIQVARDFADGKVDISAAQAAAVAAYAAANAVYVAHTAVHTAYAAAYAAEAAAYNAGKSGDDAAGDAARAAEREWQESVFRKYLESA